MPQPIEDSQQISGPSAAYIDGYNRTLEGLPYASYWQHPQNVMAYELGRKDAEGDLTISHLADILDP